VDWPLAVHRMEYVHSYFGPMLHSCYLYLCCDPTGEKNLKEATRTTKPTLELDRSLTQHNLHLFISVSFTGSFLIKLQLLDTQTKWNYIILIASKK